MQMGCWVMLEKSFLLCRPTPFLCTLIRPPVPLISTVTAGLCIPCSNTSPYVHYFAAETLTAPIGLDASNIRCLESHLTFGMWCLLHYYQI